MNLSSGLKNRRRSNHPPLLVELKRGSSVESIHNVHVTVCDLKGRVLMRAGNPDYITFIRSALKPFQVLPFISSGTAEKINCSEKGLALCCGSHSGSAMHAREAFKILWDSDIAPESLQCPTPKGAVSALQHNCSGKHAAFLATCKKMGWTLENYLQGKHPLQLEILRRISELLGLPAEELVAEKDDCGAPTLKLQLAQMALLYAHLSGSKHPELEKVSRAMRAEPEFVAGNGRFDTELMNRAHGQLLSKGGAEGIQCLSRIGEGIGIAIKVEDGSKRAKQAVALHVLKQLDWLTPIGLEELEEQILKLSPGLKLEVTGELSFQNN